MNTTKVITITAVTVVLLVVWPQTADAGTSFSIGVRIGDGSLRIGNYERDNILPGGCHTPTLHRRISHNDCCQQHKDPRKHQGGYYKIGANYHRISLPAIAKKRVGYNSGGSNRKHNRNRGGITRVRGRH